MFHLRLTDTQNDRTLFSDLSNDFHTCLLIMRHSERKKKGGGRLQHSNMAAADSNISDISSRPSLATKQAIYLYCL